MFVLRDAFEASPLSQIANHKVKVKKMGITPARNKTRVFGRENVN